MLQSEIVRENRVRREAARQGYRLLKSRTRKVDAPDFGGFMLVDAERNWHIGGGNPYAFSWSLDDVEAWLNE
jgi:hypothetical protein